MQGHAPKSYLTNIPGWITDREEQAVFDVSILHQVHDPLIVVLGVEYGRITGTLSHNLRGKPGTIYAIDLFPKDHHDVGDLEAAARYNWNLAGVAGNIQLLRGDTVWWGKNWDKGDIDILFVDADHTYEGVKADIEAWLPHVKAGGVVLFHDYWKGPESHYLHKEVKRAVDELMPVDWKKINGPDSLVWYHVPAQFQGLDKYIRPGNKAEPLPDIPDSSLQPEKVPTSETARYHIPDMTIGELRAVGEQITGVGLGNYKYKKSLVKRLIRDGVLQPEQDWLEVNNAG